MRYIVIPDIHLRHEKANKILERHAGQGYTFVFLGDYFDNFGDDRYMNGLTAAWLSQVIDREDVICLIGNHDLGYVFNGPHKFRECPGYTPEKHRWIQSNLSTSVVKKLRLVHVANGWLLSHAGINRYYPLKYSIESIMESVDVCYLAIRKGQWDHMLSFGQRMGQEPPPGGILWQDWDWEFTPISGINQIVGHTPHKKPVWRNRHEACSKNLCLDDHLNSYAIIGENGAVTVHKVLDGKEMRLNGNQIGI